MDSSADKEGLQSAGRKEQSTRHGEEPMPATRPVPGATGREELADDELDDADVEGVELIADDDDLDLVDDDEEVTPDEAERADGA
jgi:hypothetical protein